jgi:hypothetical protein
VEVTVIIHTDVIELNTVIKEVQIPNEEALIWSNDYYKSVLRKITYLMVGPSKYETWTGNDEDAYLNLQKENMESDRFLVIRNKVKGPFRK